MTETRVVPATRRSAWRRWLTNRWVLLYLALLVCSHGVILWRSTLTRTLALEDARQSVTIPAMRDTGPESGATLDVSVVRWSPAAGERGSRDRAPVVLLHGSPSRGGADFAALGPRLAALGYEVIAPDLPGFGGTAGRAPSHSIMANARVALAVMDALSMERAHIVGWSQGGGSAVHMANMAPQRVAALTLVASIGTQEAEGSGDFHFEQAKYRMGQLLLVALPEVVPHFGLMGPREGRRAFIRNFLDSDLRPMRLIMRSLGVPTLILHGRHDFLVPAWGAEHHHELIGPSTLVMLNAGHFIPLLPPLGEEGAFEACVGHLGAFFARHDEPGVRGLRGSAVFASPESHVANRLVGVNFSRSTPWWVIVLLITAATFISEDLATITVGLLIASQAIDWGVGLIGCFFAIVLGDLALWGLGRFVGRRVLRWPVIRGFVTEQSLDRWGRVFDRHTGKAVILSRFLPGTRLPTFVAAGILAKRAHHFLAWVMLAALLWTPFLLVLTMLIGPSLLEVFKRVFHGPWAIVAAIVVIFLVIRFVGYETTAQGRDRLKRDLKLFVAPEFWPAWLFYLPLVPKFAWLALSRRGPMTFTCANPGVSNGGGMIGESKSSILNGFQGVKEWVLPHAVIPGGGSPEARTQMTLDLLRERPELGGLPVVLKPDFAYRGMGVRVARTERDVLDYFAQFGHQTQVQRYHAGPYEIGVMWARVPTPDARVDNWPGEVFSATDKVFPVIEGNGRQNLEVLIWEHPRYRMQAPVFLKRHAAVLDKVPEQGERIVLARAGNHCQGTMFTDGMHLVTPALAARVDAIAQSYREPGTDRRIDFGRFDLRYEDPGALARGEGFMVIEFNANSSESTAMYDPGKPFGWGWALMWRHWVRQFDIGLARKRQGVRAMGLFELIGLWRRHRLRDPRLRISD